MAICNYSCEGSGMNLRRAECFLLIADQSMRCL